MGKQVIQIVHSVFVGPSNWAPLFPASDFVDASSDVVDRYVVVNNDVVVAASNVVVDREVVVAA